MSLFYSPVKKSSVKHGIADKSVALTVYVSLLTTQPVPVNLIQPGLISSKSHPFLGASHIGGSGGRKRLWHFHLLFFLFGKSSSISINLRKVFCSFGLNLTYE